MSRGSGPFSPAAIAGVLVVGAAAFLLFLYAIGAGWTGDRMRVTAHANSNALDGYAALVSLLEARGHAVEVSRAASSREEYDTVLVLTPGTNTDPALVQDVIEARRFIGSTILILPKWASAPLPDNAPDEARDDWVALDENMSGFWIEGVPDLEPLTLEQGQTSGWIGMGLQGALPENGRMQAITEVPGKQLFPLIVDTEGDLLAGSWNRNGYHPALAQAAGVTFSAEIEEAQDTGIYPLLVIAEPDLMNNYGLADEARARAAVALVEAAMEDVDMPVVFDLTMPGLGSTENLLTLAFRPPFLAATLCLLLAMLVIGWRAFFRFGPPVAEIPELAHGKTQLARNGAALIERARRWHLLGPPYAALVAARTAATLNIREQDADLREAAIDAVMDLRGTEGPRFSASAAALRKARRPADIVRAAHALKSIERTLVT